MNECLQRLTLFEQNQDDPLKYDFRNFLDFVYREILRFDPPADLIFDVADYMQNAPMSEDNKARGQVQCARGVGKSVIVSIFIAWLFYCNPNIKVGVICSTDSFAKRMVKFVRSIFDGHEMLAHLVPRKMQDNVLDKFRKDQLDNETEFVCGSRTDRDPDPSCKSFGITATFTGTHPDVIIADDIETPENSLTVLKRERIHEKIKEFESLVVPLGMILFLGTPQTMESLYIKYLDPRYVMRRWPAQYPNPDDADACKNVAPLLLEKLRIGACHSGAPTYPERFNEAELEVKEAIEGPIMYALQFLLDPSAADADRFPLKIRDLIIMDVANDMAPSKIMWGSTNPLPYDHAGLSTDKCLGPVYWDREQWVEFTGSVMYVDPSGRGSDEVSYAVVKFVDGMLFCPAVGGFKGDGTSDAVMNKLARIAWEHDVKRVVVEENFGSGMYTKLLQPVMMKYSSAIAVEEVKSTGQKEKRILDVLGPLTRQHRLVVDPRVIGNNTVIYQYTHITHERGALNHDDQVEALAGACAEFAEAVALDPDTQDSKRRDAEREAMARDFQRSWNKQARMGRSISIGSMLSQEEQNAIRQRVTRHPARRGTGGWDRC
jgi:hypothetical protein